VYRAISAITADLAGVGIAKRHRNERHDYRYRSIDDVLNRLSPLLAKHKLCVLPRVLERSAADRIGDDDLVLVGVTLRVAFDFVSSADGSSHSVEAFGEALDASDKATAKAMSSAYKHAMLQAFCVPVVQVDDADASTHRLKRRRSHEREPVEGWTMWTSGIIDIIESCASLDALERVQDRQRELLKAIGREKPDLYAQIGAAFAKRTAALVGERCANCAAKANGERCAAHSGANVRAEQPCQASDPAPGKRARCNPRQNGEACAKTAPEKSIRPTTGTSRRQVPDAKAAKPA
jgi:hypothetical protein